MKPEPVKSFEEFFVQRGKECNHISKEGENNKKEKPVYLAPDTQNPTSQADSALGWSLGFPFGGI